MKQSLVSIIIPCYNGERYIEKILSSVINQNYDSIQLIAVNDGSKDGTLEMLESFTNTFKHRGMEYIIISKDNGGLVSALNAGLKVATGKYINFIGQDDYFTKESVRKRVELLEREPHLDVVWAASNIIDGETGEIIDVWGEVYSPARKNLFEDMILHKSYVWPPAAKLVRASTFFELNPTRHLEEFDSGENIQIFLPIYYKGNNVGYIDEPLAIVTDHDDSYSRKFRDEDETRRYQNDIRDIFLNTLTRIVMPEEEKERLMALIEQRYQKYNKKKVYQILNDDRDELTRLYDYDEYKFRTSYVRDVNTANQAQLAAKLVFFSHSLEKSLSNDKFENGRGFTVAGWLVDLLKVYKEKGYDKKHLSYISTLSVLQTFYTRQEGANHHEKLEVIFGEFLPEIKACKSDVGGSFTIPLGEKKQNNKKSFKELAEGRSAVRTYSDKAVDKEDIKEVVEIAMKTPTVCNRQSIRVHAIYKKQIIDKVLEIQDGLAHYDTPPVLLLVTADDSGYVGPNERNQGFIDGGLFAMSVLYALEYKKLAACPAHAMLGEREEMSVRGMLGLPDSEKLITFITVGHFKEDNNVCKSFRYPAEYVLSEVDKLHDYSIEIVEKPQAPEPVEDGVLLKIRKKLRVRTRLNSGLRKFKHKTRVRTRARQAIMLVSNKIEQRKYKNIDGAILTLTGYFNYGNILQRWALQEFLRQNGYNFVSYVDTLSAPDALYKMSKSETLKRSLNAGKMLLKGQNPGLVAPNYSNDNRQTYGWDNIIDFVNKNIFIKPFDSNDTFRNYIVGSDQIWRNWWDNPESLGYYFLNFTKGRQTNRISYAASFGKDKIDEVMSKEDIEYIRPYIKDFQSISVREKSAITMINEAWSIKDVKEVVDPTLLLSAGAYSKLIDRSAVKSQNIQPIFTYILNETKEIETFLSKVKENRNQNITNIRADGGEKDGILPPIELWLKGFRDAELVVTNSFHGMMFSIINNTDFIVIGKESAGLSRVKDFLQQYNLAERFVDEADMSSFDISKLAKINWSVVNSKLDIRRKNSIEWLLESLK